MLLAFLVEAAGVELHGVGHGEGDDVADVVGAGEHHDEAVDADTDTAYYCCIPYISLMGNEYGSYECRKWPVCRIPPFGNIVLPHADTVYTACRISLLLLVANLTHG